VSRTTSVGTVMAKAKLRPAQNTERKATALT
jgi:hypothetical protein